MLKRKNKVNKKVIYLDTSAILDYILKRNDVVPVLWRSIKKRKWRITTSAFAMMEIADWKKRDLFGRNKLELKWDMDNILSHKNKPDLTDYEFKKVKDWLNNCEELTQVDFVELENEAWLKAREISAETNLLAKDALHFSTAYAFALNNECDFLITSDGDFKKEAEVYLLKNKKCKLKIFLPDEFIEKYPPSK